jgi:hypothetical protein
MYAWNQLGRKVTKGEKGIRILAPMLCDEKLNLLGNYFPGDTAFTEAETAVSESEGHQSAQA